MGPKKEGRLVEDQRQREQAGLSWKSASRQRKRARDRQKGQNKGQDQGLGKGKSKDKAKGQEKGKDPKGAKGPKDGGKQGKGKEVARKPPPPPPSPRAKRAADSSIGPQNFPAPVKSGPRRQPPPPPPKRVKKERSDASSESATSPADPPQTSPKGLRVKEEVPGAPAGDQFQSQGREVASGSAEAPAFAPVPI